MPVVFQTDALDELEQFKGVPDATKPGSNASSEEAKAELVVKEPGLSGILNNIGSNLLNGPDILIDSKVVDPEEITIDVLEDHKAIQDDTELHDKLVQQIHNVRRNSDQINQLEWDLPKSGVDSPDSYSNMQANLLKADAI
jgi:uncharacterized coiled-coil protein SlyX